MHKQVSFTHINLYIWFNSLQGAPEDMFLMQTHRDIILTLCCTLWKKKIIQAALKKASHAIEMHCFTLWLPLQGVWGGFIMLALSGLLTRGIISELGTSKHSGGVSFSSHWNDDVAFAWLYPCCDTVLVKDSWNSCCELPHRPTRSFQDALAFSPATSTSLEPGHSSRVPAFLVGWGHKAPQGAATLLHCVLHQKFRHHLVYIRCMPDAGVVALTWYPDALCIPTQDLLEYLPEDQELLYFDRYSRKDCKSAGRQTGHWVEHCLGERGMAEDFVYEPKAEYLVQSNFGCISLQISHLASIRC